jgi:hypothetical protein
VFAAGFTDLLLVSLVEMLLVSLVEMLLLFFFTWGCGRGGADGVLVTTRKNPQY